MDVQLGIEYEKISSYRNDQQEAACQRKRQSFLNKIPSWAGKMIMQQILFLSTNTEYLPVGLVPADSTVVNLSRQLKPRDFMPLNLVTSLIELQSIHLMKH
jgi:hypothetical protein